MFYASPRFPDCCAQTCQGNDLPGAEHGLLAYVGRSLRRHVLTVSFYHNRLRVPRSRSRRMSSSFPRRPRTRTWPGDHSRTQCQRRPTDIQRRRAKDDCSRGAEIGPIGIRAHVLIYASPSTQIVGFTWTGEVSPQKWMNFYTKGAVTFPHCRWATSDCHGRCGTAGGTSTAKAEGQVALRNSAGRSAKVKTSK